MKTFEKFNESKELNKNHCTLFFKVYFNFEKLYKHIDLLDENKIDYDISYHKKFIKIDAYAYSVYEYNFLMNMEYKINRLIQDKINGNMSLDKIRDIVKNFDNTWQPTRREELPYINDTNKFNL